MPVEPEPADAHLYNAVLDTCELIFRMSGRAQPLSTAITTPLSREDEVRLAQDWRTSPVCPYSEGTSRRDVPMHELSIAEAVVDMVRERTGGRTVTCVRLTVGRLAGIVTESLEFCFELATAGTPLEGAALEIEQPAGAAHCRSCGEDFEMADLILLCPCGSADVEVLTGQELSVASVRLKE